MSWAEIKKSVNSDLETPLNSLITNTQTNIMNSINSAKDAIQADGGVRIVKSVQRGYVAIVEKGSSSALNIATTSQRISYSAVNINKSILKLQACGPEKGAGNVGTGGGAYVATMNGSKATIYATYTSSSSINYPTYVSWELIEFY